MQVIGKRLGRPGNETDKRLGLGRHLVACISRKWSSNNFDAFGAFSAIYFTHESTFNGFFKSKIL